jgi:Cu/Ag efflux protein CusF
MRIYGVVVVTNLAFALGLACGYAWWRADVERLRREVESARAQVAADTRTWTVKGIVRAVLPDEPLIVITHEPLAGMMAAMTMGFRVKDRALLEGLTPGDPITFTVVPAGKDLVIVGVKK